MRTAIRSVALTLVVTALFYALVQIFRRLAALERRRTSSPSLFEPSGFDLFVANQIAQERARAPFDEMEQITWR